MIRNKRELFRNKEAAIRNKQVLFYKKQLHNKKAIFLKEVSKHTSDYHRLTFYTEKLSSNCKISLLMLFYKEILQLYEAVFLVLDNINGKML